MTGVLPAGAEDLAQVEERVERRVPAAPGDERGLPDERSPSARSRSAGPGVLDGLRRVEEQERGPDLLRPHEIAAERGHGGRPLARRPRSPC
jgi:hypothetical protein